ncbi:MULTISPECIES: response regulator [unclassified Sphingobium]|uniref:response regulator n=1 Tax=unclassified Sphingobium TaxID=2611147 RepID=UPI000D179A73|nr:MULTISPECIES: response regulator transcription factor [unclassified Sphingobium]MBG6120556.1 two-component system KDP operon response regulator KdpE [Sphingobium sp. JAI105]PSO10244.1 DNA-binding response regulator [Sphingobium sp. AEW4]TWD00606.1 two-component system KDP operon response regulator KdpE [Sphingobium sp. AEW010]TWD19707.1 two-component system KDP operon response regulator KdpE [Sphingobium sp. AEW013]TWD22292.1 two-component system KDP operon response regulator KdpE [Sphingob
MKIRHKVLIVDDEPHIRKLIQVALSRADYATVEAENAREALEMLKNERPDISLLDLGLPDRDGLELVPLFKQQSDTTLIIVSARDATDQKVTALDLGADDYLTKPFDTEELLARVRVALRNRMTKDSGMALVRAGDVEIDLLARTVLKAGKEVHLTPKEYAVLVQLAKFPGRVITHEQIMAHVWPNEREHHVEYLRVLVRTLRQKLETDPQRPRIIGNELGIGYRLRFNVEGETEEFAPSDA